MNLKGTYQATISEDFRHRVMAAVAISAQDILRDPKYTGTPRWNAAVEVLRVPTSHIWVEQFVWKVAVNAAIASTVSSDGIVAATDDDIAYVVNGAWSELFPDQVA